MVLIPRASFPSPAEGGTQARRRPPFSGMGRPGGRGSGSAVMGMSFSAWPMGAAIYLALVGGGLTAAFLLTVVLRGIRLI